MQSREMRRVGEGKIICRLQMTRFWWETPERNPRTRNQACDELGHRSDIWKLRKEVGMPRTKPEPWGAQELQELHQDTAVSENRSRKRDVKIVWGTWSVRQQAWATVSADVVMDVDQKVSQCYRVPDDNEFQVYKQSPRLKDKRFWRLMFLRLLQVLILRQMLLSSFKNWVLK